MLISPLKSRQSSPCLWHFRHFPCCGSCSLLRAHGLLFVVEAATRYLLVLQELWSLLCVDLFCLQFFSARHLLIPVSICEFCGDCINTSYSQYHRRCRSRFNPRDHAFAVLGYGRVESPPSVTFDPDTPSQETVGACLLELNTRNPPRRHVCPQLGWHEQGLKNRIGSVTREEPSFLLSIGAKTPALEVSERVQALERLQV